MKRKSRPVFLVIALVLIIAVIGTMVFLIKRYMPVKTQMNLTEYYGETGEGEATLILGSEILETKGLISGEEAYIPIDIVNTYLNQRYYWDSENQQVLYATPSELTSAAASDEAGGHVWLKDGTVYLSLTYIKQYTDIDSYIYTDPDRVAIQYEFDGVQTVTVTKGTYVRYLGGIKSEVLTKVATGSTLRLLAELEDWVQVATEDGYIGYVEKAKVSDGEETAFDRDFQTEEYSYITMDEKVNLVWHQVTTEDANAYLAESTQDMTGVNVISPTWFTIADNSGNISSIASADYVTEAHAMGLQVWGLVDNFSTDVTTTDILSSTSARQNLISQLVSASVGVGLDGINVDFEYLSEDVGPHFLEFLRELSIECHKNNLVLSVDNPVPEDFTSHYDRAEQGRVVDYIIIMGYDEHYVGSEEAGSVASLSWVEQGITDTLEEVPAERVINGMPFYTRLWSTTAGVLSSEAIGMDSAAEVIAENGVETWWDETAGQNYGEYQVGNTTYQIWLEDSQSIAEKVKLATQYDLAGVAAWKLGFENSGIWQTITENLS
ncbi:MAG: glycosyl hydrolase family 18 protein [Clostridiales bacterium]|nr:glycosyl hydrolase family 18 protein [Clostridiales bacterium]